MCLLGGKNWVFKHYLRNSMHQVNWYSTGQTITSLSPSVGSSHQHKTPLLTALLTMLFSWIWRHTDYVTSLMSAFIILPTVMTSDTIICTVYYILYTIYYHMYYILYNITYTIFYILYTIYCILYTILYTITCTILYTLYYILSRVLYTIYYHMYYILYTV